MGPEDLDRTVRVHAVRSAAVRDVLLLFGKLPQLSLEIVDWNRERARNVTGGVLVRWPCVEHDDIPRSRSLEEFVHLHEPGVGPLREMLANKTFQIGELVFGDRSDGPGQSEDAGIG
jgi:hypothetical protein